jgi:hypothetical protein
MGPDVVFLADWTASYQRGVFDPSDMNSNTSSIGRLMLVVIVNAPIG